MSRRRLIRALRTGALTAVLGGVAVLSLWVFYGPGGDLRRLKLRILLDGAAPGHVFQPGGDLRGKDFSDLTLRGACFTEADLRGARFMKCRLRFARFERCDLRGVDFRKAELCRAQFSQCALDGADLQKADLRGASLRFCSLRFALLAGARLNQADLKGADLRGTVGLTAAQVLGARNWREAKFDPELTEVLNRSVPLQKKTPSDPSPIDHSGQASRELSPPR